MLTFRSIRARGLDVPLTQPAVTAAGTFSTFPVVLVDLQTEEGVIGSAYVFAYERLAMKPLATLIEGVGALLVGRTLHPLAIERLLQQRLRMLGVEGLLMMAVSGVDMAIWDATARAADVPLAVHLGAAPRPIQAYRTLKNMTPHGAAEDAARAVAEGFAGVKVKVGGPSVADDVAIVEAIRREVGEGIPIMVDYNQVLTVAESIARGRVLDEYGLVWIEEPTLAHDLEGHAAIAREVRTPISVGENWNGLVDAARSIGAGASDYIMPDATKIGGVSGWLRTAALAEAHNIPLSGHALPEMSQHLLAATPTAHWLEYTDMIETIVLEPMRLRDGCAIVPSRPGFGIEWDERAIGRIMAG